ncbi:phosphopantetheine-binding protein [Streptomyces sp. NPDC006393]|uniref:phosphopantetheine-binding protein n=1 Tax=Streptomyces sp. NPDC006393 TaxID=3156763 RepID=UPI0033D02EED
MSHRTPADWVPQLFSGFLPAPTVDRVVQDFASHRDVPLAQLGVDSMAVMGLVLNLETVFALRIDYAAFDIETLRTMGTIEDYLTSVGCLTGGGSAA